MYGIKASDAIGRKLYELIEIVEIESGELQEELRKFESQGFYQDILLLRIKNREVWVSASIQEIIRDGNRSGWIALAIDITRRKCVEEALKQQTHELEERIKEINCLYSVSKLGSLQLDVLAASSVGTSQTAEVLTQQLKSY